ncbi:hypothetical protein BE21_12295 [Sorangium cellulosum]|uniref:Uncharacterized protein n=1 Tax=Sorangium cellulosum TaxID=56 RepID=A0A150U0B2_SORCE|nr:hypothetical protein BE21_12295 [Sorangium cellulosum]
MDATLESIFNLYVFTTGRRLFALRQVRALAKEQRFTELVKHCDAAIEHDLATRALERRWAGEPAATGANPAAQRIDVLVDRTLGAIRDHVVAQTQGAAPADPIHKEVAAFLRPIFPVSVQAITSLPYVDELAAVDDIVALLKGELAPAVREFGLGRLVTRLADLAVQYRDALEAPPPSLIDWGRVRAARAEGQGLLLEAVAIILGKHHERTREGTAARLALLAPILQQNEAIGQYLRSRRAIADVNPETGEDEPAAPAPAVGPAQPPGEPERPPIA